MTWRGSTDAKDRFFGAIVYLIPLYEALFLGGFLFGNFPVLLPIRNFLLLLLTPLSLIYGSIPFASLIVFFVLLLAVVRNPKIRHFIRFNTMQAILIDIAVALIRIILSVLGGLGEIAGILGSIVFLCAAAACVYSMVQSVLGRYPEIPSISEIVYTQVPY